MALRPDTLEKPALATRERQAAISSAGPSSLTMRLGCTKAVTWKCRFQPFSRPHRRCTTRTQSTIPASRQAALRRRAANSLVSNLRCCFKFVVRRCGSDKRSCMSAPPPATQSSRCQRQRSRLSASRIGAQWSHSRALLHMATSPGRHFPRRSKMTRSEVEASRSGLNGRPQPPSLRHGFGAPLAHLVLPYLRPFSARIGYRFGHPMRRDSGRPFRALGLMAGRPAGPTRP